MHLLMSRWCLFHRVADVVLKSMPGTHWGSVCVMGNSTFHTTCGGVCATTDIFTKGSYKPNRQPLRGLTFPIFALNIPSLDLGETYKCTCITEHPMLHINKQLTSWSWFLNNRAGVTGWWGWRVGTELACPIQGIHGKGSRIQDQAVRTPG